MTIISLTAILALLMLGHAVAQCPDAATQDLEFNSYNNAFYVAQGGSAYYRDTTESSGASGHYWHNAELIEMVEDAYDRNPGYYGMVSEICNGFTQQFGTDWSYNDYNDDIIWSVIGFARAQMITGNAYYGQLARDNFDVVWDRGWDNVLGGGIYWTVDNNEKNACINGPAAIAAMLLYRLNYGDVYLQHSLDIYNWLRATLFEPGSGKVNDHILVDGTVVGWSFTYNQGSFIGAAAYLHETVGGSTYYADGQVAMSYTENYLTGQYVPGILNDEYDASNGNGDGAGFKAVFARWAKRWIDITGDTQFNSWLQQNARAAWDYRNSVGITWGQWWHQTPDDPRYSWECSPSVAMVQNCPN